MFFGKNSQGKRVNIAEKKFQNKLKIPDSDWTEYTIRSRKFNASATSRVSVSSRPQNSLKLLMNYLTLWNSVLKGENRHRPVLTHKTNVIRGRCFYEKISK